MWTRILGIALLFFSLPTYAWYPTQDDQEFRVVVRSNKGLYEDYTVEGQMFRTNLIGKVKAVSGFRLSEEKSAIGGSVIYPVNPYISVAMNGDLNAKLDFGGSFWVHGNFPYHMYEIKPFVKITHQKLGEVGVVVYINSKKANFHVGFGVETTKGLEKASIKNTRSVFIIGASFSIKSELLKQIK